MKFTEFANKQKNIIKAGAARRVNSSIPISEAREAFYTGKSFKKYDLVESEGIQYRIVEQCSNYFRVVDSTGEIFRKFQTQLKLVTEQTQKVVEENSFHGYGFKKESTKTLFESLYNADEENDDVGILKQLKEHDMNEHYDSADKLVIAKIIADAVGYKFGKTASPDEIVAEAMRFARLDERLSQNPAILDNMASIAKEVGMQCESVVLPNYHPEHEHIQNSLAQQDINSLFDGNKIKVHKSNLWKAARHVNKMGYKHLKVVGGLNEEVQTDVETEEEPKVSYKDFKNKLGHTMNPTSETNRRQIVNKLNGN